MTKGEERTNKVWFGCTGDNNAGIIPESHKSGVKLRDHFAAIIDTIESEAHRNPRLAAIAQTEAEKALLVAMGLFNY